jgi:hypothetical protein
MTDKKEYERLWDDSAMGRMGCGCPVVAVIIIAVLMLCSCATKTVVEYRDRDVNHYITNTVHDTLRIKETDSTHVETITRNDTVFYTVYREKTRWRDRVVEKHDTCYRDSVATEYKETVKEVVKYPKTYWFAIGISILFFIFAFVKLIRWIRVL